MRARYRLPCLALGLLLAVPTTGCQSEQPYGVVEGVVTLDGKPLTRIEVAFLPDPEKGTKGPRSVALTDENGHYRIASDAGRAGAPVGFHRVCITDMVARERGPGPAIAPPEEDSKGGPVGTKAPTEKNQPHLPTKKGRFPAVYTTALETPLRDIEVKEGSQVINLELKSR
jgi:hypothetical protein